MTNDHPLRRPNAPLGTVGDLIVELQKYDELSQVRLLVEAGRLDGVRRLRPLNGRRIIEATPTRRIGR